MAPVDPFQLTCGEIAKFEDLAGISIRQIQGKKVPMGRPLAALAFVYARRNGEPITWAQALDLTMEEASAIIGTDDEDAEPDPHQMNRAQLRELASSVGIEVQARDTKSELIAKIEEHRTSDPS